MHLRKLVLGVALILGATGLFTATPAQAEKAGDGFIAIYIPPIDIMPAFWICYSSCVSGQLCCIIGPA